MVTLLKIVGFIWALIGLGNLIGMPWTGSPDGVLTIGLMFNMLLFIIPGLIVYGIGAGIKKRQAASTEIVASKSTNEFDQSSSGNNQTTRSSISDIEKLGGLKEKGFITDAEFEAKKKQLLGL